MIKCTNLPLTYHPSRQLYHFSSGICLTTADRLLAPYLTAVLIGWFGPLIQPIGRELVQQQAVFHHGFHESKKRDTKLFLKLLQHLIQKPLEPYEGA